MEQREPIHLSYRLPDSLVFGIIYYFYSVLINKPMKYALMKQAIAFLIVFNIFGYLTAQYNCVMEVGDTCYLQNDGTEFRSSPNYRYQLLGTINEDDSAVIGQIAGAKIISGYVNVKLIEVHSKDSALISLLGVSGWVKKTDLECFISVPERPLGTPSTAWDANILKMEELKKRKRCTYSKQNYAGMLLARGRARYNEENYEGAAKDLSQAIDLLVSSDNLIIYHWYRAHARSGLGDYQGAVSDFEYILEHKEYLESSSYDFDVNEVLCWKAQNHYFLNEDYKAKSLLKIVIASDPEYGFAYYLRGLVKCYLEDKVGGCKDFHKAAELGFDEAVDAIISKCN